MGCSHSTQSRTTRRRRRKRKRKVEENVESKEMRLKRQIAPTEPVSESVFQADLAMFTAAPEKNYRSEHIDLVKKQPNRQPARTHVKQAVYTGIYNMRVHYADQFECRIRGAEFLPNGNLLVCDQPNERLKLWSSTFQYLSHYDLPGAPHTICLHSSNRDGSDVYVTIPKNRTVQEFFIDGKHIIPGQKILTDGFCYGIAPYKYGLVVGVGTKIEFLDTDGHVIKTLQYAPGGTSKFGTPFHLAVTEANNILVSDSYKGTLLCITPEGDEIFKYDNITIPHGVTTDKEENLYICGNEKGAIDVLHQLTIRGQKVKSLLSWRHLGFTPDVVCYRQKDKLLAVCGEYDRIKTFRLDTKISGKIYPNDVIMDSERIQTERSTKEVQDIMKRILQS